MDRFVFADQAKYALPEFLDALTGPSCGVIHLSRTLSWGPEQPP